MPCPICVFAGDCMTPEKFIDKWSRSELKEKSGAQEHFIDLCRLLGEPTPAEADPKGDHYCFERGANKDTGQNGWADVWKRHHFAWEYKGKHSNLDEAFNQLRQYTLALESPPLLIVSDMERFRIHTNWTNSVSKVYKFQLDDLRNASTLEKFKWAFSDPDRLRPGESRQALTEQVAETFAPLAQSLRQRGHNPQEVAHFINRLIFCMFSEDVGLLPNNMFTRMLKQAYSQPEEFFDLACKLFGAMSSGGRIGFERVVWFNGRLFDDETALPLKKSDIEIVLEAAALDWAEIDPSIFGTLFERGLDPDKRSQLGAHYTDRDKIMRIIEPTIVRPWLDEWKTEKLEIAHQLEKVEAAKSKSAKTQHYRKAERLLVRFLKRLQEFTVLDPACGSGNFLYLALHELKDLEHQIQIEAGELGLERQFPAVGPANLKGIEKNTYAAELARISIWIGNIQWMRRNGFAEVDPSNWEEPILEPLDNIECRDAILSSDGKESEWPQADVVIGNPPFLGYSLMRKTLGDDYANIMRKTYKGFVPASADLVCYWFHKAGKLLAEDKISRAGLVATNSIGGGLNRTVLDRIVNHDVIFDAWSKEPWIIDGAAVSVSLICFASKNSGLPTHLNGTNVSRINADLTAGFVDLTKAKKVQENQQTAFIGGYKKGGFDISGDLARKWLCLPKNPNSRSNADVLRPWVNGKDITSRSSDKWVINFDSSMSEADAAIYEVPFSYVSEHVKPVRIDNKRADLRDQWWLHDRSGKTMFKRVGELSRYIATPRVAKHRLFVWCNAVVYPDSAIVVIARDDDTTFGILHSRFHEQWSLMLGTSLEDRPRYTPTTTFQTFPFPNGLTPNIPADEYADNPLSIAIANAARRLVELRNRWLNPLEWVKWMDEPVPGYPKRPVPRDESSAEKLKKRTLTDLYNSRPQWLADAHANLDTAVANAYGWPADISDDDMLRRLLELNLARAKQQ